MKISELIEKLEAARAEHGDLPVFIWQGEIAPDEAASVTSKRVHIYKQLDSGFYEGTDCQGLVIGRVAEIFENDQHPEA